MSAKSVLGAISEPIYYHREYDNDVGEKFEENSWGYQCQRIVVVALPFFSLYRPLSFPISLGMGALRIFSNAHQLFANIQQGNSSHIHYQCLQTTIAVVALAGTIFAHPAGMLITAGHDIIIEVISLVGCSQRGEHRKALESCANIINQALYLALFTHGSLELAVASFAMQTILELYHSHSEFLKGNYLEASGHLLVAMVRGNQMVSQAQSLQMKWKLESLLKETDNAKNQEFKMKTSAVFIESKNSEIDLRNLDPKEAEEIAALILKYKGSLYRAAAADDLYAVEKFLKCGGDSQQAFHGALTGQSMSILKYLFENSKISPVKINSDKSWPYSWKLEWWAGLDYLVGKGVTVPFLDYFFFGNNQQIPAVLRGLISRGSKFSPNYQPRWDSLFQEGFDAVLRIKILESLRIDCGLNVDGTFKLYSRPSSNNGCTPLIFAVINKDIGLAKTLLELGADPNLGAEHMRGTRGSTPMWYATHLTKNQEMIALLITYGAKMDL